MTQAPGQDLRPGTSRWIEGAEFYELANFRLVTLLIESQVLLDNPLGDPTSRRHPVLVPKADAPAQGWPVVVVLAGFTGNGPNYFNLKSFERNLPQTLDRQVSERCAPRGVYVFVDAMTSWGGSQFINGSRTGRYQDYVVDEIVSAVKREFRVSMACGDWCVTGGSSGGYGALHLASARPDVFGRVAATAPDSFFEASLLPEYWAALPVLESLGGVEGVRRELDSGRLMRRKDWHTVVNAVAMGLCYAPPAASGSAAGSAVADEISRFPIPIERRTGRLKPELWASWKKHDPIVFLNERIDDVKRLSGIFIDVGNRDQFHLQFGARQIHDVMESHGVQHQFTEFDGNHFDIGERRPLIWKWLLEKCGWLLAFVLTVLVGGALLHPSRAEAALEPGEICGEEVIMTLPWKICLIEPSLSKAQLQDAITVGMDEVHRVDEWMSEWKSNSMISEINRNAGIRPVKVSDEAIEAISLSLKHSELTHGAFDITFNAFFGLYSWKPGHERFPTPQEIKKLLPLVNYKNVIVDAKAKTVFLKEKGMKIGLGGMGEGWAVDKVVALLKAKKIKAGYVDASGAVSVWGVKPSGKLWSINIGDPRPMREEDARRASIYKFYATDVAVTTAGDTEKFFIKNGHRYHHIIDPKTGESATRSIQVTAICKSATLCDLVDDGVFILGKTEGLKYAESQGVAAMQIDPDRQVHFSKGLHAYQSAWGPAVELK